MRYGRNDIAFNYPAKPKRRPNLAVRTGEWKLFMNSNSADVQLYNMVKNETTELSAKQVKITNE